jgi:hypothetical protein
VSIYESRQPVIPQYRKGNGPFGGGKGFDQFGGRAGIAVGADHDVADVTGCRRRGHLAEEGRTLPEPAGKSFNEGLHGNLRSGLAVKQRGGG